MKKSKISSLFTHDHPNWLLESPTILSIIHASTYLVQLRKWYVTNSLSKLLRSVPFGSKILDVGCGEGQYLLSYAKSFPNCHFVGIDKNEQNIQLCRNFIQKRGLVNVSVYDSSFESMSLEEKYNVAICVGVLQYIKDDRKAIECIYDSLLPNGKLLIYSPINNRIYLPFYERILKSFPNYETIQNRNKIYNEQSIQSLLHEFDFTILTKKITYGIFGALSNELINACIILFANLPFPFSIFIIILLIFIYPLILLLMILDYILPKHFGNGVLLLAQKKVQLNSEEFN